MTEADFAKLHGPVGLRLGAKTPAEIAVSILAEIVEAKNATANSLDKTPTQEDCAL